MPNNRSLVKGDLLPVTCTDCTHLFLELVELGDVVEEGGDDGGEQEELFGREVLEGMHYGEVPLDRHRPAEEEGMGSRNASVQFPGEMSQNGCPSFFWQQKQICHAKGT